MFLLVISFFIFSEISFAGDSGVKLSSETCRQIFTSFPSFAQAMEIAQSAGIKTQKEYRSRYKELGLPSHPDRYYKSDWQGYGHFLGTGRTKGKNFPSFAQAMEIAQSAGIKTQKEYRSRYKELGLPSFPDTYYKSDWQSYGHFLGTGRTTGKDFPSFAQAMEIVQSADIIDQKEYQVRYKELGLPSTPDRYYKSDWQDYGHFLGTGRAKEKAFPSFDQAMKLVQLFRIKTEKEYQVRHKELGLPSNPDKYYKSDWQGYGHFLGTSRDKEEEKRQAFPSFDQAMERVQSAGIKTIFEYYFKNEELGLPMYPQTWYKWEWQGWTYFLGSIQTSEF